MYCIVKAQNADYKAYTVNDGLPSNHVYRCLEDDKGFLWIATDAGVARFDGKKFQVFTKNEGLPDNEVLSIVKEKNGTIWANCFNQSPAYFDEVHNRFIKAMEDNSLANISGNGVMYLYTLNSGGVLFYNDKGSFVFKNNRIASYDTSQKANYFLVDEFENGSNLKWKSFSTKLNKFIVQHGFYEMQNRSSTDSLLLGTFYNAKLYPAINEGIFYIFNFANNRFYIYSNLKTSPISFRVDSVITPFSFENFSFTANRFYLIGNNGKLMIYNKYTGELVKIISGNYLPNSYYNDKFGNEWISTRDKGLLAFNKKYLTKAHIPNSFHGTNFISLARGKKGKLFAGNYYGQIVAIDGQKFKAKMVSTKISDRQRKIIITPQHIFAFSDEHITIDFKNILINPENRRPFNAKSALVYNDSLIICGTSLGFRKLNYQNLAMSNINVTKKRITAMAKDDKGMIYFGSTDGLYQFDFINNSIKGLQPNHPLFNQRITSICSTSDGLLWVATPSNGIIVVKDNKMLNNITTSEGIISNAGRVLIAGKLGQVWMASGNGISNIRYTIKDSALKFTVQNLTVNDGLCSNEVNEMIYYNDTIFAATADGISLIPTNISVPLFNIPVYVTGISINQRDTIIASNYNLAYHQQNIVINFAGVELNGHFNHFQYTIDNNTNWINLYENTLALELNSGKHTLQIRCVDVNGNISNKILTLQFNIAIPFWQALWFWILIAIVFQVIVFYIITNEIKKKKEAKLAKELAIVQTASLEQQAFTSLMNPHFMFNALNSIQHYINLQDRQNANRYLSDFASLIRKNFEAAQLSFIPLEQELENIKIYLRLEQMRFANKFIYTIDINDVIEIEQWMIPTMMIQPLLENALLHGIMPSAIKGELSIILKEQNNGLLISITDNGIGIQQSQLLKQNTHHKSHGMGLIKKRIDALTHFVIQPITLTMAPAFNNEKNPGNTISLFIPATLYNAWLRVQNMKNAQ